MNIYKILLFLIFGVVFGCNSNDVNHKNGDDKTILNKVVSKSNNSMNCNCEENPQLGDVISCDETLFSNGAKIYRQYNCDSSWVVFQNKNYKKIIYSLEKQMIEYTHKLGYVEWAEYENSILISERLASGSSAPYNYIIIDKDNGNLIKELGRDLYLNENKKNPIFVSIDAENPDSIKFIDLRNNKTYNYPFKSEKFLKTLSFEVYEFHPEELFENASIKNGVFNVKYRYKQNENDYWKFENITIDLNNKFD
jgi:hypothetical protein